MHSLYLAARRLAWGTCDNIAFPDRPAHRQPTAIEDGIKQRRTAQLIVKKRALGNRATEAKRAATEGRYWITKFCHKEFPDCRGDDKKLGQAKKRVWSAMSQARKVDVDDVSRCASKSCSVEPRKRFRMNFTSPRFVNEVIREELFAWFIDSINNVRGRLPSFIILAQAVLLAQDYRDGIRKRIEAGDLDPSFKIVIPIFDFHWLFLWRRQYHLSWRTVNLHFKVSFAKMKELLLIFWTNILKIRWLHYFLFGCVQILKMINCDEKPFHFTSAIDAKTLAPTGSNRCPVIENFPMSRSRFTWKTRTGWPELPKDGKIGAVLFRGTGLEARVGSLTKYPS